MPIDLFIERLFSIINLTYSSCGFSYAYQSNHIPVRLMCSDPFRSVTIRSTTGYVFRSSFGDVFPICMNIKIVPDRFCGRVSSRVVIIVVVYGKYV